MFIESVKTPKGIIYGVELGDTETQKLLETLGVNLVEAAKTEIQKKLLKEESSRLQKVLSQYGYNSLADVVFYAQTENDEEAKSLLNWYSNQNGNGYDDLIWSWIDNELPKYQSVDELLNLDLKQIEAQIFEKTKSMLPKEEE